MNQIIKKWYFKKNILIIALLTVGPFALPLLWFNPHYSKKLKIISSIIILIITYYLGVALIHTYNTLNNTYQSILQSM